MWHRTSRSSISAGHGYAMVGYRAMRCDRIRLHSAAGDAERNRRRRPLRYRVAHTAKLWKPGERPQLAVQVLEGDPGLSI
jgi:alkaline phosphatase D